MSDRIRTWSALAVILVSLATVAAVLASSPTTQQDRVDDLASRLKCPICESETIADSPSQVARDAYDLIAERVADGWSDQQIIDFFVATYGESVLLDPPARGRTLLLWLLPVLGLGVGGIIVASRRGGAPREIDPEERARIRAALEERR